MYSMKYKGDHAKLEYDPGNRILTGGIIGIPAAHFVDFYAAVFGWEANRWFHSRLR